MEVARPFTFRFAGTKSFRRTGEILSRSHSLASCPENSLPIMKSSIRLLPPCLAGTHHVRSEAPDVSAAPTEETVEAHNALMQWFRGAKFGIFIHWGLYSQLAGEWQIAYSRHKQGETRISVGCYQKWKFPGSPVSAAYYCRYPPLRRIPSPLSRRWKSKGCQR